MAFGHMICYNRNMNTYKRLIEKVCDAEKLGEAGVNVTGADRQVVERIAAETGWQIDAEPPFYESPQTFLRPPQSD